MAQYALPDNVLFVPEVRRSDANAAQAYYVLGHHDAIGISPFSIEGGSDSPDSPVVAAYSVLRELTPLIARYNGSDAMDAVMLSSENPEHVITDGHTRITLSHYFTLPWDPRAKDGSTWPETGGILMKLGEGEYILAGTGIVAKFEHESERSSSARLGEDGFLNAGADRVNGGEAASTLRTGLASSQRPRLSATALTSLDFFIFTFAVMLSPGSAVPHRRTGSPRCTTMPSVSIAGSFTRASIPCKARIAVAARI